MHPSPGTRAGRHVYIVPYWTTALGAATPNATIPVASWSPATYPANVTPYTNIDVAIVPKGTGSLLAQVPDNTTTGGNKRGTRAVDLQLQRTAANMVAGADYSTIVAGRNNLITTSSNPLYAGILGGRGNSITTGGTASTVGSAIVGGDANTITDTGGIGACAIIGGASNSITCSGTQDYAAILAGFLNLTSGKYAAVVGGRANSAAGDATVAMGWQAKTRACIGSLAHGANSGTAGNSQHGRYVLRQQTTNATVTAITQDGGAASGVNQVGPLPTGFVFAFEAHVVVNQGSGASVGYFKVAGIAKNQAGTLTVVSTTTTTVFLDAALAGVTVAAVADNTNKCVQFQATGLAATTIQWALTCLTTETV